ncbi:aminotransferase [Halalkalibacterium halodurans]|jgi:aminotransferase|uniref:Aminotransferase n=2 Tax=Halalkalibacterium halodurans TaxID=86665 RepID=Q9K7L1_HALH5|nr:aminotransferase [Halalkalibacterium halodurans]MDY7223882.1 aminotransferase [Halalkalibacterium halodurans]MDY7243103.1 aminotransferase [Halalkalibacterium halodurans]MED3648761.1 aminotransferase [Halalkalibacterium halodurans]MED4080626.1 aminotransferase [Halalkalibacterium halodurans]MED4085687.1 aminotransferase [Halalkalibacterium halodurans]
MTSSTSQRTRLSTRVQSIQPSGIRRFFDLASKMENIISLGVGEPDFVTPWNVREASISSMERGFTAYSANAGIIELREAISRYLYERFHIGYDPESEILVTVGASEAIDIGMRAIIDEGDEVIVVEPSFVSYAPLVTMAGGVPVPVGTHIDTDFQVTPAQIEAAITPRTKAIILCFPNNPTGSIMGKEELEAVAKVISGNDLIVFSDEIYAELTYDGTHVSLASMDGMRERTVLISGFSKAFAMTGWRLGYVCAPDDILSAMLKIHQYSLMCAPTMAQHGALEALETGMDDVHRMVQSYRQRRNFVVKTFTEIGLTCPMPGGAFYAFPSVKETGLTSEEFAERLLMEEHVAVVPGNVFGEGGEGHIRCSYATSMEHLETALERIGRFVQKCKQ